MHLHTMVKKIISSGWTQKELALLCNVTQPTISELYTGKRADVFYKTGKKIEGVYEKLLSKTEKGGQEV